MNVNTLYQYNLTCYSNLECLPADFIKPNNKCNFYKKLYTCINKAWATQTHIAFNAQSPEYATHSTAIATEQYQCSSQCMMCVVYVVVLTVGLAVQILAGEIMLPNNITIAIYTNNYCSY